MMKNRVILDQEKLQQNDHKCTCLGLLLLDDKIATYLRASVIRDMAT